MKKRLVTWLVMGSVASGILTTNQPSAHAAGLSVFGIGNLASATFSGGSFTGRSLSFGGGIGFDFSLMPSMVIDTNVIFLPRATSTSGGGSDTLNFIQVPVLLRFFLGPVTIGLGPYVAMQFGDRSTDGVASAWSGGTIDFGFTGAAGALIALTPGMGILAEGRFDYGLTTFGSVSSGNFTYNEWLFLVGMRFGL